MRKALTTLIYDGEEFFKIWYQYYTQFFAEEDIFILSFQASPHIFENLKCNVIEIKHSIFSAGKGPVTFKDATRVVIKANELQRKLFNEGYQCVVHADLDEIIYYPGGLDSLIESQPAKFVSTAGYEIVQYREKELPLDFSKPVLGQRSYWYRWDPYDKPLILWTPINWIPGFHGLEGFNRGRRHSWIDKSLSHINVWPDLYLLHLHKMDERLTRKMHATHNVRASNGVIDEGAFDTWWKVAEDQLILIPDIIKNTGII